MASYRLGGIKATYHQKQEFIFDLLDSGHDIDIFVGYALTYLTWREVQEIGFHMARVKDDNDRASKVLLMKEINRTDSVQIKEK
jgi:hypothetical protein